MKTSFKVSVLAVFAAVSLGLSPKALAASPNLSISNAGGDNVNVTVNSADAYSQVQLLYTVSGSSLPTQINNFGQTNGSGYFSTVISGSAYGLSGGTQVYAMVNGQQSNIVNWNNWGSGCSYYGCNVGGLTFGQTNVNLNVGQSIYISISSGVNMSVYYPQVTGNSNSNVARASISGNQLYIIGDNPGSTTITVCLSGGSTCGSVYVTVSGNSSGQISFSQSSVSLNQGQSQLLTIYSNNYNNNYYISANTNSSVVTPTLSGNTLNLYGNTPGYSTVTVCQSGYSNACASVSVTVANYSTGSLSFLTTSLPQATVNQYYSYQLQASGGSVPYSYSLYSGQLPAGLSLSSGGQIFGTPLNNNAGYFTVRANDNYGRYATMNFTLSVNGVLGATSYNNGTLINDNGTIYLIYRNTKTGFASAGAFLGLGFGFGNAIPASTASIPYSGYTVTSAAGGHPWGSWVKSGGTIYFVHEQGLIPIPDWSTFTNNGGNSDLVVLANSADFQRSINPIMVFNDSRLK